MKRVMENADWTLFRPSDAPDLHDKVGKAFEEAYLRYEDKAARGELKLHKKIPAVQLWRKMLSMLFETGHPWITFKDPCNLRSPQQHVGVVHSSNLCTEITLNTTADEIAVCNLGSVNLVAHMTRRQGLDFDKLQAHRAHRDAHARQRHRHQLLRGGQGAQLQPAPPPGGPGHHGLPGLPAPAARALRLGRRPWSSPTARWKWWPTTPTGRPPSWPRSAAATPPSRARCGTAASCRRTRSTCWPRSAAATSRWTAPRTLDWEPLRARIQQHGMRNSNCIAIAPTATIANIVGVSASIEPTYQNLYVKSNLSGEFTVVNEYLVSDLKRAGLWDEVMIADLKYFDGNLARIDRVPAELRQPLRHRVRGRAEVAGRSGRAAPEVDRPGAVAQHLHGRRLGQEARRDLQAGLDPRPEDHLLPARPGRHARREIHLQGRAS